MTTAFDLLGDSRVLKIHWLKRAAAYAIDCLVVLIPTWAVLALLGAAESVVLGLVSGVLFLYYSALSEAATGRTVGKAVMKLTVRSSKGKLTVFQAFVRNVPKFFWYIFPPIDAIAGMASEGDPRQRLSDRILGSTVVQAHYLRVKVHRVDVKKEPSKPPAKA